MAAAAAAVGGIVWLSRLRLVILRYTPASIEALSELDDG